MEYNEALHQLFADFNRAYSSVRRMCLNETYSRDRAGRHLSDMIPIRNGLKQGDALSPLLFNFALQHAISRDQVNQDGLKSNTTHSLVVYANEVNVYWAEVYIL